MTTSPAKGHHLCSDDVIVDDFENSDDLENGRCTTHYLVRHKPAVAELDALEYLTVKTLVVKPLLVKGADFISAIQRQ